MQQTNFEVESWMVYQTFFYSAGRVTYRYIQNANIYLQIAQLQKCCLQMLLYDTYIECLHKHIQTVCCMVYEKYCTVFNHCAVDFSHLVLHVSILVLHVSYLALHLGHLVHHATTYEGFDTKCHLVIWYYMWAIWYWIRAIGEAYSNHTWYVSMKAFCMCLHEHSVCDCMQWKTPPPCICVCEHSVCMFVSISVCVYVSILYRTAREGNPTTLYTCVGVSCGYTDHYQGRGHSIRPTATLINIHEHLI